MAYEEIQCFPATLPTVVGVDHGSYVESYTAESPMIVTSERHYLPKWASNVVNVDIASKHLKWQ